MEKVTVGKLSFEQRVEADSEESVVVTRAASSAADSGVYATWTRCGNDLREWNYLKKNSWPANGVGATPPAGKWVLLEFIGHERSSSNLEPERHVDGFTERELMRLTATVNAIFGDDDEPALVLEPKKRKRKSRDQQTGVPR